MSNTKRPAARKPSKASEAAVDQTLEHGIAFTDFDGTRLQVRVRDVKGAHDAALVGLIGTDFMGLLEQLSKRQGLDLLAAMVWFGRLVNGREPGDFGALLDDFGYEAVSDMDFDEPKPEDDAPEA